MINIVDLINSLKEDRNNGQERIFKKRFPDHYKNICSLSFPESFRFSQKIYHYIHNDEELKLGKGIHLIHQMLKNCFINT